MNPKLIIGLGNRDNKYENTYHNMGHLFINYIKDYKNIGNYVLFKPDSFMNESGKEVLDEMKRLKLQPEEILIIHDDSDLRLGKFKFSFNRGGGGHKGVESIIQSLRTKNFWRLRIGIRPEQEKIRKKANELVLRKITKTNIHALHQIFEAAYSSLKTI